MLSISTFIFIQIAYALNAADYPRGFAVPPTNAAWTSAVMANKPSSDSSSDYTACQRSNHWALTYDDGPAPASNLYTNALNTRNIKATFFVVGSQVLSNPEILLSEFQQGHEIAIHTWSHSDLTTLSNDQIVAEIVWTAKIIYDVTGAVPTLIRPPYGSMNTRVRAVLKNLGMSVVNWNRDTFDWTFAQSPPTSISGSPWNSSSVISDLPKLFQQWANAPQIGTISLEHDLSDLAIRQVPAMLDTLLSSRFSLVKISECLGGISPYGNSVIQGVLSITGGGNPVVVPSVAPSVVPSVTPSVVPSLVSSVAPSLAPTSSATPSVVARLGNPSLNSSPTGSSTRGTDQPEEKSSGFINGFLFSTVFFVLFSLIF